MRSLVFALLLLPSLSHAVNLIGVLPGKWHGTKHRAQGVTLQPDRIHFRYCKPSKIVEKGAITETGPDAHGFQTLVHPFRLYSRGPTHLLHCLPPGHHACVFTVGYWESHPSQFFLTLACEGGFVRSFVRQNYR